MALDTTHRTCFSLFCMRRKCIKISHLVATQALVVLTSLYVGYRIGARPSPEEEFEPEPEVAEDKVEDEPNPEEPIWDGDLAAIKAGMTDQCKMVSRDLHNLSK